MTKSEKNSEREHNAESRGWHGWGTDAWALHVGPLPGRKSVCLYYESGCIIDPLAYFRDDESAFRALAIIDNIVKLHRQDVAEHSDGSVSDIEKPT